MGLSSAVSLPNHSYSFAVLVAVMQECCVKRVICKTWIKLSAGILANSADPDQTLQTGHLITVNIICLKTKS